jgi:DTW domain-containing protein YfiP
MKLGWQKPTRPYCAQCRRSALTCYCASLKPFDPKIRFVILIHGREAQKKIATGRLTHLSLASSELIEGIDFTNHPRVEELLSHDFESVVLFPGPQSLNLSSMSPAARRERFSRPLQVFVIDGTWSTAPKIMRSKNLECLPRICFDPPAPSRFRVRRQPGEHCYSTLEATHQTIELLGEAAGFSLKGRSHDALLKSFDAMVEQQISLSSAPKLYCQWKPKKAAAAGPCRLEAKAPL